MNTNELTKFIADAIEGDERTVRWYAGNLRDAQMLPSNDDLPVSFPQAIDLFLAVLAASRPADAVSAAKVIGALPVTELRHAPRNGPIVTYPIEDVRILAGAGPAFCNFTFSLRVAIQEAIYYNLGALMPEAHAWLAVSRDLEVPEALHYLADGRGGVSMLVHRRGDGSLYVRPRTYITAVVPHHVLRLASAAFARDAERLQPDASPQLNELGSPP